jgi:hypothetical protein
MIFASLDHLEAAQDDLSGTDVLQWLNRGKLLAYWLKFTGTWAKKIKKYYDDHPTGVLKIVVNPYSRNPDDYLVSIVFYELSEYYRPGTQHISISRVMRVFYARDGKLANTRVKWRQLKKDFANVTDNTVAWAEGGVEMLRKAVS